MGFYQVVGVIAVWFFVFYFLLKLLKGLWTCGLANALGFGVRWRGGPNTWAVVTGSTDGIGLQYAHQLAQKGYSLLLISRNAQKLEKTREEISSKYSQCANIKTVAVDFTLANIYEKINSEVQKLDDIHVLVNNVGISYEYPEFFTQVPNRDQFIDNIINANVYSCTRLIAMVLPKMEAKSSGVIINISSYSASYPTPLLALYAGTKVYVDFLSRALQVEYGHKGIVIQSVLPAYVSTNMSKIRRTSAMVPSPADYVRSALKTVGIEDRTYGFWTHKLQGFVQDTIISNTIGPNFNVKLAFDSLKDVRRRYYKKNALKEKTK